MLSVHADSDFLLCCPHSSNTVLCRAVWGFLFNFTVAKQECFFIYLGLIITCLALKEVSILNRNNV